MSALRTPLYDAHLRAGGRMVTFAGYDMPVQYEGVIAESKAVREACGMFDVSHMARLRFTGEGAFVYLEHVTSNDVSKLADGSGQYSLLPNERGGVVDDIIVYRIHATEFRMVVNAANHEKDVTWLRSHLPSDVVMEDKTSETAMIAVQGPTAVATLAGLSPDGATLQAAGMFGVVETTIAGLVCFCARSGYTGEDGYELICAASDADALWTALVEAGVKPCGLGSRDVLRVEAGLPLYGHELSDEMSPISAALGWVIGKEKAFIGSSPIREVQAHGSAQKLVGIRLESKRVAAIGAVVEVDGRAVGAVSSGVYSPALGCGIAFAFIESGVALKTPCTVEMRGKPESATIVGKRFLRKS